MRRRGWMGDASMPDNWILTDEPIDDDLPISITHSRDIIVFDGKIEQDYRFLNYRFAGPDGEIVARAYLDDIWTIAVLEPLFDSPIPAPVLAYLQRRFHKVTQLGGAEGYTQIWSEEDGT